MPIKQQSIVIISYITNLGQLWQRYAFMTGDNVFTFDVDQGFDQPREHERMQVQRYRAILRLIHEMYYFSTFFLYLDNGIRLCVDATFSVFVHKELKSLQRTDS